jgi:DNA-binding NarL/FixJ family response regulator
MAKPTRRQLEALRAYIRAGSVAAAAYELGIGETTVRQHLSGLYRRTGCVNAAQAAYWLGSGELPRRREVPAPSAMATGRSER